MALPLINQGLTFGKALVRHALDGFATVSPNDQRIRLDICEACEFRTRDLKCEKCGCFVVVKSGWASESCPLGKWPEPGVSPAPSGGGCGCAANQPL